MQLPVPLHQLVSLLREAIAFGAVSRHYSASRSRQHAGKTRPPRSSQQLTINQALPPGAAGRAGTDLRLTEQQSPQVRTD